MSAPFFPSDRRKDISRAFFFGAFLFLLYQLLRLLFPFFTAIMVAVTLTLIFYPVHAYLRRKVPGRETLAAAASTALLILIVILPVTLFGWLLIQQSAGLAPFVAEKMRLWRETPTFEAILPPFPARLARKAQDFLDVWQIDIQDILMKNVDELGRALSSLGARIVKNVVFIIFEMFVSAFTLFFLFRDGEKLARRIVDLVPMEIAHKQHILERLGQTLSAVVRGIFITAAAQGLLAGMGYAAAGIRFSVILGFSTAFTALIPFVGATAVWLPVSLYLILSGASLKGYLLMGWGLAVVSAIDNFLRPILIGDKAKLPILFLFFGMLGGLKVYGPIGLLAGPLLIACALAFIKIFREMQGQAAAPRDQ